MLGWSVWQTRIQRHPLILQPGDQTTWDSYNREFLQPGVLEHGFLQPEVLQAGLLTTRVLQPELLKTRDLTTRGSYNQEFLQPRVLQQGVLTTRGLTTKGSYNQASYKQDFLQPGILQAGLLTTRVLQQGVLAPGGVLPYMGYIGMCRCEGYGFQAVYPRIGYINQSVWL